MPDFPTARVLGFLGRFILIYGLLIIPWTGWNATYGSYFRSLGGAFFSHDGDKRIVKFETYHDPDHPIDTVIIIANRDQIGRDGKGPSTTLGLDGRAIGWVPTALTAALILATAVPWRRRLWSLFWGVFWIHAFILFSLDIHIWYYSYRVGLVTFTPFWNSIIYGLDYTLIVQMGVSFSVPVLIWILVTFRSKDLAVVEGK